MNPNDQTDPVVANLHLDVAKRSIVQRFALFDAEITKLLEKELDRAISSFRMSDDVATQVHRILSDTISESVREVVQSPDMKALFHKAAAHAIEEHIKKWAGK